MRVAVTGASGFLGRNIVRTLRDTGHDVVELVRRPSAGPPETRRYDLTEPPDPTLLDDVDAVVHCAFARAEGVPGGKAFRENVDGTLRLFERALTRGVGFLFVSSFSAIPTACSVYGRQKLELERLLGPDGACIIRPGLVVGNGGLIANLLTTMRKRRILPLIDGGTQPVQSVWIGDICSIVQALVERRCPAGKLSIAADPPITIGRLARDVRDAVGLRAPAVSIPFFVAYGIARALEFVGQTSPLGTENLLGLRSSCIQPTDDVVSLGVRLLPWEEQLTLLATTSSALPR